MLADRPGLTGQVLSPLARGIYIDRLEDRGVDLSLSPAALSRMSRLMGFDVTQPITQDRIERSRRWIDSSGKRIFEQGLCSMFAHLGGEAFSRFAENRIDRLDPGYGGTVRIDVGFLGSNGPILRPLIKIRTMIPEAPDLRENVFDHTSFRAGRDQHDDRVLNSKMAHFLRRTGLDEAPQVAMQVPKGEMRLVGARGYTLPELDGTARLIELADDPRLGLSQLAKQMLKEYPGNVDIAKPDIAFAGVLQAMDAKETPHLVRMFGDVVYWRGTSPAADFRIAMAVAKNRAKGVGAW